MKGRKRHLLVDAPKPAIVCIVHAADMQDRGGAEEAISKARWEVSRLRVVRVDAEYAGKPVE